MACCSVSLPIAEEMQIPERTLRRKRAAEEYRTRRRNPKRACRDLTLMAGPFYLPKGDEDMPLGQDAHFICDHEQTIGIADGVGGYSKRGIDSGVYARQLMDNAYEFVRRKKTVDPMKVLEAAFERSSALGGSTACIITLKKNSLHAVNLGDSQFMVVRGDKTVYKSPVQQRSFNCPFQLGAGLAGATTGFSPSDGDEIVVDVEPGDVLVAGTDGLFDNMFDEEIATIVRTSLQDGKPPELVAAALGQAAREKSFVLDCETPFSREAEKVGKTLLFGKYDDVTVIVGCIF